MIDIYHSRRGRFRKCLYWQRNNNTPVETLVMNEQPAGVFYASEVNAISLQNNNINGNYLFDKDTVLLVTDDDIHDIKNNCVVKYNNQNWLVVDVQVELHMKETEFSSERHATRYIALRR